MFQVASVLIVGVLAVSRQITLHICASTQMFTAAAAKRQIGTTKHYSGPFSIFSNT